MKNNNLTNLDTDQIVKRKFEQELDAERVYLVGGDKLDITIDSDKIASAVREALSIVTQSKEQKNEVSQPIAKEVQVIEKNVFIPQLEIKTIEMPVIIKEIEYREIEKPIYIEKVIHVDKPIIIKEIEFKEIIKERNYPLIIKASAIVQAVCILGLLLINLLKK